MKRVVKFAAGFIRLSAGSAAIRGLAFVLFGVSAVNGQAAKQAVEVPFEFAHNQIVIQVKIAGKGPYAMLLDTNTDPSAIDVATATHRREVAATMSTIRRNVRATVVAFVTFNQRS